MKETLPLSDRDVNPFLADQDSVVRIFKNQQWFIGGLYSMNASSEWKLRLSPITGFKPHNPNLDPKDPGVGLVVDGDVAIPSAYQRLCLPFTLHNVVKVQSETPNEDLLVITFDDGAAIFSTRAQDITGAIALVEIASRPH